MIKTYKILYVLRLKVLQLILRQSFITPYFCFAFSLMGSLGEKRTNKNYTMQYITLMSRVTKKTLFEISTLKTTFEVSIRKDMNFAFSSKYTKLLNIALNKKKKKPQKIEKEPTMKSMIGICRCLSTRICTKRNPFHLYGLLRQCYGLVS